jgi:hypothetical protein
MTPTVVRCAAALGLKTAVILRQAPALGGAELPADLFALAISPQFLAEYNAPTAWVIDLVDRCIGAAMDARRAAMVRLFSPWCWVVDVPSLILRLPFLILRGAGLPPSVEESLIGQVAKVALLLAAVAVSGYFGAKDLVLKVLGH